MAKLENLIPVDDDILDSSPSVKLSQATIDKFTELDAKANKLEDVPDEEPQFEDAQAAPRSPARRKDEGLDEEGQVIGAQAQPDDQSIEQEEPEAPAAQPAAEKATQPPIEMELPNRLLQAARRANMDDNDVLALGERAEQILGHLADNFDKVSQELGELGRLRKEQQQPAQAKPAAGQPPQAKAQAGEEPAVEPDDLFGMSDKTKELLDKKINALEQEVLQLRQKEEERTQVQQRIFQQQIKSTCANFFDTKAESYPELGKQATLNAEQEAKRTAIYDLAENIGLGSKQKGKVVTLEEALAMAFNIYEGQNARKSVRKELISEVRNRDGQRISRPTARRTQDTFSSAREKAMESYRRLAAAKGLNLPAEDEF